MIVAAVQWGSGPIPSLPFVQCVCLGVVHVQRTMPGDEPTGAETETDGHGNVTETLAEFLRHEVVDEGVDARVEEPDEVRREHGEEEVGLLQEAVLLHLADEDHHVKWRPRHEKRQRHHDDHPGHLQHETEL